MLTIHLHLEGKQIESALFLSQGPENSDPEPAGPTLQKQVGRFSKYFETA